MTTPQPAALPECIAHVEDWPDDRTPIGLVWDVDPASVPVGTNLYALAALQPQPAAAVSDGALDEILRAAVAQAIFFKEGVQTVEQLRNQLRTLVRRTSQVHLLAERESHMIEAGRLQAEIRRLQSLRPQAVPMTPGQMRTLVVDCGYDHASTQERADFINGVRTGERWHGITAQGAQGGEG